MDVPVLTGAQKSHLRGLGQRMDASLKLGRGGATPAFFTELGRHLRARELVKLRFVGVERDEREALCGRIAAEGACAWVGAVGHTALFYLPNPDASKSRVALPCEA